MERQLEDADQPVTVREEPNYTRDRLKALALLIAAAIGIVLTLLVAGPFIPGLTWALAFAVVANPLHERLCKRIAKPDLAAGLGVAIVAIALVIPAVFVGWQIGKEASEGMNKLKQAQSTGSWRDNLKNSPRAAAVIGWLEGNINIERELGGIGDAIQQRAGRWARTLVWGIVQLLIALFALFYFFRDKGDVLRTLRSFMPLSDRETDELFDRIRAMTHATIYGTLVVSFIQGTLAGMMFWFLGIPGALLWGFIMGLLNVVPVLGSFVIWGPVAVLLAAQGEWGKALILTGWGVFVVGVIDNLLYPILVGKEIRLHTLPVFIAIIGGLFLFGAAGLVLGPVVLAATIGIVDILRRRTAFGRSVEEQP
jgi:predicted PurR-regulated permease PerM